MCLTNAEPNQKVSISTQQPRRLRTSYSFFYVNNSIMVRALAVVSQLRRLRIVTRVKISSKLRTMLLGSCTTNSLRKSGKNTRTATPTPIPSTSGRHMHGDGLVDASTLGEQRQQPSAVLRTQSSNIGHAPRRTMLNTMRQWMWRTGGKAAKDRRASSVTGLSVVDRDDHALPQTPKAGSARQEAAGSNGKSRRPRNVSFNDTVKVLCNIVWPSGNTVQFYQHLKKIYNCKNAPQKISRPCVLNLMAF